MTRVLVGIAACSILGGSPALANTSDPEVTASRLGGGARVVLRAGELSVTQTLGKSALELAIVHGDDALQFAADLDGRVTIARGDERLSLAVRRASAEDQRRLSALLADSPAFAAFDALLESDWAYSSTVSTVFRTAREVIRVLEGDIDAVLEMAATRPAAPSASVVRVRQRLSPSQCWETYNKDVVYFTYQLQWCLSSVSSQWWNPLATAWCAYEYNLKSSLASIWLLDCYGVM